jgi:hypothetical protein
MLQVTVIDDTQITVSVESLIKSQRQGGDPSRPARDFTLPL